MRRITQPSHAVQIEIRRKLWGKGAPREGQKRRPDTRHFTTLAHCEKFNGWVRQNSRLGELWRDEHSWRLLSDLLREEVTEPLLIACAHLLALHGPYRADLVAPETTTPLAELMTPQERAWIESGNRDADAIFRAHSKLRSRFVTGLVLQGLDESELTDEIRERQAPDGRWVASRQLAALTDALFARLSARMASMSDDDWAHIVRSTRQSEAGEQQQRAESSIETKLSWLAGSKFGRLRSGDDEGQQPSPAPHSDELATEDAAALFKERSHESIELLYGLARAAEEFTYVLLAHRRALRLLPYFAPDSAMRVTLEGGILDPARMTSMISVYRPIRSAYDELTRTFDGRVLLRALSQKVRGFLEYWPPLLGDGQYEYLIATTHEVTLQKTLLEQRSHEDLSDFAFFWYRANGTERYLLGDTRVANATEITDDWDLLGFYSGLLRLFPDDLMTMEYLRHNADLNLTSKLQKIQRESFPGNTEHEDAISRALKENLLLWEVFAPGWVQPIYEQVGVANGLSFDSRDYRV